MTLSIKLFRLHVMQLVLTLFSQVMIIDYNRTKPLKGGKVDKDNGTVYLISGTTGDKTYPTTDTGFEFDKYISQHLMAYILVFQLRQKNSQLKHAKQMENLLDTYTRTKEYKCDKDGHEYEIVDGYAVCIHCKETISLKSFTGIAKDKATGKYMDSWAVRNRSAGNNLRIPCTTLMQMVIPKM